MNPNRKKPRKRDFPVNWPTGDRFLGRADVQLGATRVRARQNGRQSDALGRKLTAYRAISRSKNKKFLKFREFPTPENDKVTFYQRPSGLLHPK